MALVDMTGLILNSIARLIRARRIFDVDLGSRVIPPGINSQNMLPESMGVVTWLFRFVP